MFSFLKYIRPIWYYSNYANLSSQIFSQRSVEQSIKAGLIATDTRYDNSNAQRADLIYQSLLMGIIPKDNGNSDYPITTVEDAESNYQFISKYFPFKWYLYCFIHRIISLHNPLKDFYFFCKFLLAKKYQKPDHQSLYSDFTNFRESFSSNQLVSVIIPTLNRYDYLKDVFSDLQRQSYKNFEVIVCDQSDAFDESVYNNYTFPLEVIRETNKALWNARNLCIKKSRGNFILLFDDDSRVDENWILNHLSCVYYFNSLISAGVTDTIIGNKASYSDHAFHLSDVFDTGNALVAKSVFDHIGLFDTKFEKQRMGDAEFGNRAVNNGYKVISNPFARRIHLKVDSGGLREFGSWDAFRPKTLFSPRPVPSVLYYARKYFGNQAAINYVLIFISNSIIPYKYKNNRYIKILSPFLFIIFSPLLILQLYRSWSFSSVKLQLPDNYSNIQ